ncbi:hypothetical protein [Variovorax sp. UC122_21]|uniref:hypothetical protein n=1 Tax=Variovorax sp. UC122_21 TaxID=3374554 RepID=UPI0037571BC4
MLCLSERALEMLGTPDAIDVAGAQWLEAERLQPWSDARRFEGHEFHPGLRLALGAACDYALAVDPARIARQNARVRQRLAQALQERFGWQPLEAGLPDRSALLTYRLPEAFGDGAAFVRRLADAGVHASFVGPQHARWALEAAGLPGVLRLTPHYLTDEDEIARLVEAIETHESPRPPLTLFHRHPKRRQA